MINTTEYSLEELSAILIEHNKKMLDFSDKLYLFETSMPFEGGKVKVIVVRKAGKEESIFRCIINAIKRQLVRMGG